MYMNQPQTYAGSTQMHYSVAVQPSMHTPHYHFSTMPAQETYHLEGQMHFSSTQAYTKQHALSNQYDLYIAQPTAVFSPETFITQPTRFIGSAAEIEEYVKEAFLHTTGKALPDNIEITLCTKEELKEANARWGGTWSEGIQGFCINKHGKGISHVFVKTGELANVMLTVGHELGHVQSPALKNHADEEAKAFAFSMAFMNAIRKKDIAGLKEVFVEHLPAHNGIHDVGYVYVANKVRFGEDPFDVFRTLVEQSLNTQQIGSLYGLLQRYG